MGVDSYAFSLEIYEDSIVAKEILESEFPHTGGTTIHNLKSLSKFNYESKSSTSNFEDLTTHIEEGFKSLLAELKHKF